MITPRRTIYKNVRIERERRLPITGKVLVKQDQEVTYDQIILEAEIKGDLQIIRLQEKLGLEQEDINSGILVKVGELVKIGQEIFKKRGLFKFMNITYESQFEGMVEFVSELNGHIGIRERSKKLEVSSFIPGKIVAIQKERSVFIKNNLGLMQGVVGYGGERTGKLKYLELNTDAILTLDTIKNIEEPYDNLILVGGKSISPEFFKWACDVRISGIVCASLDSSFVKNTLNTSVLGVLPEYSKSFPTVMIIEGFGDIPLSEYANDFFKFADNKMASINGVTQVRAGAIRPELIVHEADSLIPDTAESTNSRPKIGDTMRIVRGQNFGQIGQIKEIPSEMQKLNSGIESHVAILVTGKREITVSLANLESV